MDDAEYERRRRWERRIMDGGLIAGTMTAGLIVFDGILGTPVAGILIGIYVGDLIRRHNQKMRDHVLGN